MESPMLDLLRPALRVAALTALSLGLTHCSSDGGTVAPPTYGAINFVGPTITNNSMTLPCDTNETFMITQPNFGGTFSLAVDQESTIMSSVTRSPKAANTTLTVTPTSGTAATTFTLNTDYDNGYTYTITATGGGGITGTLNITAVTVGNCG
jgi:hypothetical protein